MVVNDSMKAQRLALHPAFPDLIARAGLSQRAFARRAGVSFSTIMGLLHPTAHPGRTGGMQRRTAWLLAKAYADVAGIDADLAFRTLIIEESHKVADHAHEEGTHHDAS